MSNPIDLDAAQRLADETKGRETAPLSGICCPGCRRPYHEPYTCAEWEREHPRLQMRARSTVEQVNALADTVLSLIPEARVARSLTPEVREGLRVMAACEKRLHPREAHAMAPAFAWIDELSKQD
jgi:hypothetical protein